MGWLVGRPARFNQRHLGALLASDAPRGRADSVAASAVVGDEPEAGVVLWAVTQAAAAAKM